MGMKEARGQVSLDTEYTDNLSGVQENSGQGGKAISQV